MQRGKSLKTRMLVVLIVPILLIWGGVNIYSYNQSETMLEKQIMDTLSYAAASSSERIYNELKSKEEAAEVTAIYLGNSSIDQQAEMVYLKSVKAATEGVQSVYTGYADKTAADSQGITEKEKPAGYDPTTRVWYKAAMAVNGVAYTPVYEESKTKNGGGRPRDDSGGPHIQIAFVPGRCALQRPGICFQFRDRFSLKFGFSSI